MCNLNSTTIFSNKFTLKEANIKPIVLIFLNSITNLNLLTLLTLAESNCNVPVKFYEDLHCTPIYKPFKSNLIDSCPESYDCSHLTRVQPPHVLEIDKNLRNREAMCYFDGNWIEIGAQIEIPSVCGLGICTCTKSLNFDCTKQECPYLSLPDVNKCFHSFVFDECCPKSVSCLNDWKNFTTCNVKDTIYLGGELFPSPLDNCKLCVCNGNFDAFDSKYGDGVCQSVPCKVEIEKSGDILNYCAPVYLESTDCCPVDVRCPTKDDIIALAKTITKENEPYCQYGSTRVPSGVKLVHSEEQYGDFTVTECYCKIPPFVTCFRTYYD